MEMKNINLPLIALRGMTVLPDMVIHFDISRKKSIHAVEKAMEKDQKIFLATQVDPEVSDPEYEDLYHVGTLVKIKQLIKLPNSVVRVLVEGVKKGTLEGVTQADGMLVAEVAVNEQPPQELDPTLNKAMLTGLRELIRQYALANPRMSRDILKQWLGMNSARKLLERFTIDYPMEYRERQHMLELDSLEEMYEYAGKLFFKSIDLSDSESIRKSVFKEFVGNKVVLDVYVNNAAMAYDDIVTNLNLDRLKAMYAVNVFTPMMMTKYAIRNMLLHHTRGSIVHISSISAHTGYKGLAMYASSKGALEAFSKDTAREWGGLGIRSNVRSVAETVSFLVSEKACSITGQNIHVDNGTI